MMNDNLEQVSCPGRKAYDSPRLTVFGALESLTAAGSPTCIENGEYANRVELDEGSRA